MNGKELFALRKSQGRDFASPEELRIFLETMLGQDFFFPVVQGPEDFPDNNWVIRRLPVLTPTDRMTIENYLEALKELQKEHGHPRRYTGRIYLPGLDSTNYRNYDTNIATASIKQQKTEKGIEIPSFDLSFYFSARKEKGMEVKKVGYAVSSTLEQTELQKICARFNGPNTTYKRLLI